jgi:Tol biopolymer transport system component
LAAAAVAWSAADAGAVTSSRLTYISAPTSSGASPQLVLARANGAGAHALGPASTAVLSPDGAYVAAVGPGHGSPATGSTLVLYAVGSKKPARTLRVSAAQLTILAWAPDDGWIAVTDGNSLVAVPLHGAARTLVTGTIAGASFAPHPPDRLVFAQAASLQVGAQVNLFRVNMTGGQTTQLTSAGLNEYPLWGPGGIVYSHAASSSGSPLQLWRLTGAHAKAITDVTLNPPWTGFEPVALSANGQHLLANLVGDNASQAWCINLDASPVAEHALSAAGTTTIGNAISRDGSEVLMTEGAGTLAGDDYSKSTVAVVPWNGGAAKTVAQHSAFASWDR